MYNRLNIIICCDRCNTSFLTEQSGVLYIDSIDNKIGIMYNCPGCNYISVTSEWIRK